MPYVAISKFYYMEIIFISNNHYRINDGVRSNIDNQGAFRGIRIKPLENNLFLVSIEILSAPFYQFNNDYQMSPKVMQIILDKPGEVQLRGINENSDYIIKMESIEEYIKSISLIMLDRNSQIVYLNAEKRSETPVNTDNLAIAKILEMFVEEYDQEEKTSSLTLRKISKKFGGVIDEQTIIKLINLLNSNSGKQILIPYKTIKIPDDKIYFSLLSPEYEDAYYTEFSLSLLKSLINTYQS